MAKLVYKYGAMNSGKSMAILQIAYNYEENNKKVLLVKSCIDTKGENYLVSRIGPRRKIGIFLNQDESLKDDKYLGIICDKDIILVDEAQFLTTKQVNDLWFIAKNMNKKVICYGLKTNFKSEFFEGSKRLFEVADEIVKLETLCSCGNKAEFNARKVNGKYITSGKEFVIDGEENIEYIPLCSKCYLNNVFLKKE